MPKLTINVHCKKCNRKLAHDTSRDRNYFWCPECNKIYYTNITDKAFECGFKAGEMNRSNDIRKMLGL